MRVRKMLAVVAAMCLAASMGAQQIQVSKENKTIAITTSDEASAVADTAVVSVGFQSYGKDQQGTYDEAARTSNAIVAALTGAGVPKEAIESTDQGISPLDPNGDENKARYGQGLRFQFRQSWRVTVPAAEAAKVLAAAATNGANNSGNIDWQLKHEDALQAEAAQKALQHARDIASSMAKGLGVKLGALVYASNQAPQRNGPFGMQLQTEAPMMSAMARKAAPIALSPQRITRSATVYAVFAIE